MATSNLSRMSTNHKLRVAFVLAAALVHCKGALLQVEQEADTVDNRRIGARVNARPGRCTLTTAQVRSAEGPVSILSFLNAW